MALLVAYLNGLVTSLRRNARVVKAVFSRMTINHSWRLCETRFGRLIDITVVPTICFRPPSGSLHYVHPLLASTKFRAGVRQLKRIGTRYRRRRFKLEQTTHMHTHTSFTFGQATITV